MTCNRGLSNSFWQIPDQRTRCVLLQHLWSFENRGCHLPQDEVFGLLTVCVEMNESNPRLQADYSIPTSVVLCRAAQRIILTARKLPLFDLAQSDGRTIEMPS
jgi:hypothetical protein